MNFGSGYSKPNIWMMETSSDHGKTGPPNSRRAFIESNTCLNGELNTRSWMAGSPPSGTTQGLETSPWDSYTRPCMLVVAIKMQWFLNALMGLIGTLTLIEVSQRQRSSSGMPSWTISLRLPWTARAGGTRCPGRYRNQKFLQLSLSIGLSHMGVWSLR